MPNRLRCGVLIKQRTASDPESSQTLCCQDITDPSFPAECGVFDGHTCGCGAMSTIDQPAAQISPWGAEAFSIESGLTITAVI